MRWWHYSQNNSGGYFSGPAHHIVVEANAPAEADKRAEEAGAYFDGCDTGNDCWCCGDRWRRTYDDSGDPEPMIYGEPAMEHRDYWVDSIGCPSVLIVHADGTRETHTAKAESLFR